MLKQVPIELCHGLPILTNDLEWREGCPLYVCGAYAALQLGPDALNVSGAISGSRIIAAHMSASTSLEVDSGSSLRSAGSSPNDKLSPTSPGVRAVELPEFKLPPHAHTCAHLNHAVGGEPCDAFSDSVNSTDFAELGRSAFQECSETDHGCRFDHAFLDITCTSAAAEGPMRCDSAGERCNHPSLWPGDMLLSPPNSPDVFLTDNGCDHHDPPVFAVQRGDASGPAPPTIVASHGADCQQEGPHHCASTGHPRASGDVSVQAEPQECCDSAEEDQEAVQATDDFSFDNDTFRHRYLGTGMANYFDVLQSVDD